MLIRNINSFYMLVRRFTFYAIPNWSLLFSLKLRKTSIFPYWSKSLAMFDEVRQCSSIFFRVRYTSPLPLMFFQVRSCSSILSCSSMLVNVRHISSHPHVLPCSSMFVNRSPPAQIRFVHVRSRSSIEEHEKNGRTKSRGIGGDVTNMDEHGRIWMNIDEHGRTISGGLGGNVTSMDEHGRTLTNMNEPYLGGRGVMDEHGRTWTNMDEHGRTW